MTTWAAPTAAGLDMLSYDEAVTAAVGVRGGDTFLIGTVIGQKLAFAMNKAFGKFHDELEPQGWSEEQVDGWLAAKWGRPHYLARVLVEFINLDCPSDMQAWTIIKDFERNYKPIRDGVVMLKDVNGVMSRDVTTAAAEDGQAQHAVRNERAGNQHGFDIDASPRQFMGNDAAFAAAGWRGGNGRFGSL